MPNESVTKPGESVDTSQFVSPPAGADKSHVGVPPGDGQAKVEISTTPKTETPSSKETTPKETESKPDDKTIDFDDFESILGNSTKSDRAIIDTSTSKKEESTLDTSTSKKDESNKEEVPAKKDESQAVSKEEEKQKGTRDYSGLDETEIPLFKAMSRDAFDKLKPMRLQYKELEKSNAEKDAAIAKLREGALPENYYEHERAYTLTPAFEKEANKAIKAGQLVDHYKAQLAKVKEGDDTFHEVFTDPSTGEFFTRPVKADSNSVALLEAAVEKMKDQHVRVQQSLQSLAATHGAKFKESVSAIKEFENAAFKNFNGDNAKTMEPLVRDTIAKVIPIAFQNNPLATVLAKSLITTQQLGSILKKMTEEKNKTVTPPDKKILNPTQSDMSAGGGSSNGPAISIEEFDEYAKRS